MGPEPNFNGLGQAVVYFHKNNDNLTKTSYIAEWTDHHNVRIVSVVPYTVSGTVSVCLLVEKRTTAEDTYAKLRALDHDQ